MMMIPFSSALSEQERKEEIIKEKENLSLQLNAEQLKTNFDSCLIDDIVEWIATTDCISVHGETIEHEYLKEEIFKVDLSAYCICYQKCEEAWQRNQ